MHDPGPPESTASVNATSVGSRDGEFKIGDSEKRVRTPLFPTCREVRQLLRIWPGRPRKQVTALRSTIGELRGTPQNTVDWTNPDAWIPERLSGEDRDLAAAVCENSEKIVNPRHTYGHWLLVQKYELVEEQQDTPRLTDRGREFLENKAGDATNAGVFLDEQEGLAKLLSLVADNGPTRAGGVLEEWSEHLNPALILWQSINVLRYASPAAQQPPRPFPHPSQKHDVLGDRRRPRLPPASWH